MEAGLAMKSLFLHLARYTLSFICKGHPPLTEPALKGMRLNTDTHLESHTPFYLEGRTVLEMVTKKKKFIHFVLAEPSTRP